MNIIRWSFANGIRRTRWLSISSPIHRDLNNPLLFHPSQSPLPSNNRPLPYNLRALSDNTSSSSIHEDVKPEPTQTVSQEQQTEEEKKTNHDIKDDQTRVLQAALEHVPTLGWTEAAMVAGAREVGLSPSIVGAFPRKEAALVEYFMDDCLQRLLGEIESREEELSNLVFHDRIAKIIRIRLEMQVPYISKWPQALSIQANPLNLPTSFKQRAVLVDEIWHASGDRSTDLDWYAKRTLLGGIYAATELYMLTDYSPEFRNTWIFLDRRVSDAVDCRKTAQEAAQLATAIGAGIGNTVQAFLRRQTQ